MNYYFIFMVILLFIFYCKLLYKKNIENFDIINKRKFKYKYDNIFSKYNKAIIFGKGPTFKNIRKKNKKTLYICINDTANVVKDCDILLANDYDAYKKINDATYKNINYILMPYYYNYRKKNHHKKIVNFIKKKFDKDVILYNIYPDKNYLYSNIRLTSSNNAFDIISKYFPNIKKVSFYGIGKNLKKNQKNYSSEFKEHENVNYYKNNNLIKLIRKNLNDVSKKRNVKIRLN